MSSIYKKGRDGYYYYQSYVFNSNTGKKDKRIFHALGTKDPDLAKKKQIPILPMATIATIATRYWTLSKTWDQFRIPKPFTTVSIYFSSPIMVETAADITSAQRQLEIALNHLEKN